MREKITQTQDRDKDTQLKEKFHKFILDNKFTREDVELAYYQTFGVTLDKEPNRKIVDFMNQLVEEGLPSNSFLEGIQLLNRLEQATDVALEKIQQSNLSDREKKILSDVLGGVRQGELTITYNKTQQTISTSKVDVRALSVMLNSLLEESHKGNYLEISFEEN